MSDLGVHPPDAQLWDGTDPAVLDHLDRCAVCRSRRRTLQAAQSAAAERLAEVAGPVPMPPDVQRRISRALAQESARRSVTPLRRRSRPWLAAAAAAAAVVVGVGVVVPRLAGDRASDEQAVAEGAAGAARSEAGTDLAEQPPPAEQAPDAAAPGLPADLVAAAQQATISGDRACGTSLAAALGATVVGARDPAAAERPGVLVVLDEDGQRWAWWLPACDALPEQALGWGRLP